MAKYTVVAKNDFISIMAHLLIENQQFVDIAAQNAERFERPNTVTMENITCSRKIVWSDQTAN